MKKFFAFVFALALVIVLAGCKKDEKKVLKFAVQDDSTPALKALVEEFNKGDHGYEVELVIMTNDSGQMHDQLVTSLSSGSSDYDIISMDVVWAGEFAAAGYLEPLDELLIDAGWKESDFNAGSMASGKYSGKNYALPYFPDLGFLYYRKDIVSTEDATKLESGEYTWEDLLVMAEKYADEDLNGFVFQAKQYEGLVCNFNEFSNNLNDIEEGLKILKQFVDSTATPDNILTYTEGETHNAFLQGKAVFARNWPYMNGMVGGEDSTIKANQVGYAPLPQGGTVGGWLVGINKNTDEMDGAIEFLKFLAGPTGQKINATKGKYLPGYNKLLEDEAVLEANELLTSDAFQIALQNTIARPVAANYSQVSNALQLAIHNYLSKDNPNQEDLNATVKAIEDALK